MTRRQNLFDPVTGILNVKCRNCGCEITRENCVFIRNINITVLGQCLDCYRQYCKIAGANFRKKNVGYSKRKHLKERYNMTEDQLNELRNKQNNTCAICKKSFSDKIKPYVDHNHVTNEIRELLCNKCNVLVAMCNDNTQILANALSYLIKHTNFEDKDNAA